MLRIRILKKILEKVFFFGPYFKFKKKRDENLPFFLSAVAFAPVDLQQSNQLFLEALSFVFKRYPFQVGL